MADNITVVSGNWSGTHASDDIGGVQYPRVKIVTGADGTANDVSAANPVPVSDASGSLTVDGTVAATQSGTWTVQRDTVATATLANVTGSATSVTLLASNASAKGRVIYNDSTAILYLKFGATASATSFTVKLMPDDYYEFPAPLYTGVVDGIWASATGTARCTEW